MAYRLQELSAGHERILFICGMSHLERIRTLLRHPLAQPLTRARREGVTLANLHPDCCHEILAEYPQDEPLLHKFILPASLRFDAMRALYRMNITNATLFPDLDGLAKSIAFEDRIGILSTTLSVQDFDVSSV